MIFWDFYRRNPTLFMMIVVIYISVIIIIMTMIILFINSKRKGDFDGERRHKRSD